jgi:hypothetical protein
MVPGRLFPEDRNVMPVRSDRRNRSSDVHNQHCRELWGAVVLQAKEDIRLQPIDSIAYDQAVAFFTASGEWGEMRMVIADFLEMHRDDLEAAGRGFINARRALEGVPPLPPRQPKQTRSGAQQATIRRTGAMSPGPPVMVRLAVASRPKTAASHCFNPFFPRQAQSISP